MQGVVEGLGGLPGVGDGTKSGEGKKTESNMIYRKGGG